MLSDEWLGKNYQSSEKVQLSKIADYKMWADAQGNKVGVTLNFEYADDVHYDMTIGNWNRFLQGLGINETASEEETLERLRKYFSHRGFAGFEATAEKKGIEYTKMAFYGD